MLLQHLAILCYVFCDPFNLDLDLVFVQIQIQVGSCRLIISS